MNFANLVCLIALCGYVAGHGYVSRPIARQVFCKNHAGNFYWPEDGSGITNLMCKSAFYHVAGRWNSYDLARQQFIQINEYASLVGENFQEEMTENLCGAGADNATIPFGDKSGMSIAGRWMPTIIKEKSVEFEWCVTAHHVGGYLEYYITRPDVDVDATALRIEHFDLMEKVEHTVLIKDSATSDCPNGQYFRDLIDLPHRPNEKHYVVLARWQRRVSADGSTEGFYNCIDLKNRITKKCECAC